MLGRFKPVEFNPYGRRRPRRIVPRWPLLLLAGIVIGAAAVIIAQERYLPPRLSAEDSAELRRSLEQTAADRARLNAELGDVRHQLDTSVGESKNLGAEVASSRQTIGKLREDVASLIAALPPDPRAGAVEVRAARFDVEAGALAYEVMLTRDRAAAGKPPLVGVMQLVLNAEPARGASTGKSVSVEPVPVSIGAFENVRGRLPLPEGFKPRQATVQILDRADGKRLGMRVMYIK